MKTCFPTCSFSALLVITLFGVPFHAYAQSPPPLIPLRLEVRTNGLDLVVSSLSSTGALFIQQAADLPTLAAIPALILQTNTPLANVLRLPVLPAVGLSNQVFFSALYWPGLSLDQFADPEEYPPDPAPAQMLFTSGVPTNLASGQTFTADFFVADSTGQPVDITGTATILVVRESDSTTHPDAIVTPPSALMTNGYMRVQVTVNSTTPLDGYSLGLSISLGPNGFPHPNISDTFLRTVFNLGPAPLSNPTRTACIQALGQLRTANADSGATWSYPLTGSGYAVSGTFGEWRGKKTASEPTGHVHDGLDLAAPAGTTVLASRGGVISHHGTLPGMGDYLVIDHGTGWFSRYLHLNANSISVGIGQAVVRGGTLATRLYSGPNWGVHFHFEVRLGANQAQWENGQPGVGQDPLQTAGIFAVPSAVAPPRLEAFGLTCQQPGQNAFVNGPQAAAGNGPVYVFAKFVDVEGGSRLGLRAMDFQPEGAGQPDEIKPQDDASINLLRPPGNGQMNGFALYPAAHANGTIPQSSARLNYFRYWFLWDTSGYANARQGPRTITLTGKGYSGSTTNYTFTFGPKIKGGIVTPVVSQPYTYTFTNVAYLGTNLLANRSQADTNFSQPDQYKLQILQGNGQPLRNVIWTPALQPGDYTPEVFTVHKSEAAYTFTLPGGASPDWLKLRVTSRMAPDIAHEKKMFNYVTVTPPQDSNGTYGVHLQPAADDPVADGEAGPRYRLKITGGKWVDNQAGGRVDPADPSVLFTDPIPLLALGDFMFYLDSTPTTEVGRLNVQNADASKDLDEELLPSVFVFDDYVRNGTFYMTLDGQQLNPFPFTQSGTTGKVIDIAGWQAGQRHVLSVRLDSIHGTGLPFVVACLWVPPWFEVTNIRSYYVLGNTSDTGPSGQSPCVTFQQRGVVSIVIDHVEIEVTRRGP
jgi:murein DD-endopeptidase MepM/ murein hydrolase activator NlpD